LSHSSSATSRSAGVREHDRDQAEQSGEHDGDERRRPGLRAVQAAHALGVDEDLAEAQAREERRGHAASVLVEELDEVELRADGDDQLRALLGGDEHRHVLARARRRHELEGQPERLEVVAARSAAVGIGVDDELSAAAQRALGGGVHVADDHVGLEALVDERVRAAVNGQDRGLDVADVGAQRAQVLLVVDAADDDERRPVAEIRVKSRQLDPPGQELALLEHVLDRVLGEGLECVADLAAPLVGRRAHGLGLLDVALGQQLARAPHLPAVDRDLLAVLEFVEEVVVLHVDEVHPRLDEQQRTHVRVRTRRGRAAVEDGHDARRDEILSRDPVEVTMVQDRDRAMTQRLHEELRAAAEACGPRDLPGDGYGHRRSLDGVVNRMRSVRCTHRARPPDRLVAS